MLRHVYGQPAWHDPVYLVGTADALRRLRDALTQLIEEHATASTAPFYVSDGEGFVVHLRLETAMAMNGYCVPYTADYACLAAPRGSGQWPRKDP